MGFSLNFRQALLSSAMAFLVTPVAATEVLVNFSPSGSGTTATIFYYGSYYGSIVVNSTALTHDGQTFEAFVASPFQQSWRVGDLNFTINQLSYDNLSRLFAVAGFNGAGFQGDAVDTPEERYALQLAVWELGYDGLGGELSSGNFKVIDFRGTKVEGLVQGYLAAAAALKPDEYVTDNLYYYTQKYGGGGFVTTRGYAAISAVPEPSASLLWFGGLAGLAVLRRCRGRSYKGSARAVE
jgi:hypothetical protein